MGNVRGVKLACVRDGVEGRGGNADDTGELGPLRPKPQETRAIWN